MFLLYICGMRISVIAIGDELLLGEVTDTNSGFLARTIAPAGWSVARVSIVPDNAEAIYRAIERAFEDTDIVITTGGLGPTKDDITLDTLCCFFRCGRRFDDGVAANVERVMARRGRAVNELTRAQAIVPDAACIIQNRVGTAPIMWFEPEGTGRVLVAMPGVPFETEQMFCSEVFPRLLARFASDVTVTHRSMIVVDISESAIAETLSDLEADLPDGLHLAYLPCVGYVRLRLDAVHRDGAYANGLADRHAGLIAERLGSHVISREDVVPARLLLSLLAAKEKSVATAESCTGGNIAHELTLIPGASAVMKGGVVAYDNEVKKALLGVGDGTLASHGAVSIEVVEQMAVGVCRATGASVGIATSGIAGPGGGSADKPVGTVCIAVAVDGRVATSRRYRFAGNRSRVIDSATAAALVDACKCLS